MCVNWTCCHSLDSECSHIYHFWISVFSMACFLTNTRNVSHGCANELHFRGGWSKRFHLLSIQQWKSQRVKCVLTFLLSLPSIWMCEGGCVGVGGSGGKAWCDVMLKELVPHPDQIRVMEANEKTPVPWWPLQNGCAPWGVPLVSSTPVDTDLLPIKKLHWNVPLLKTGVFIPLRSPRRNETRQLWEQTDGGGGGSIDVDNALWAKIK